MELVEREGFLVSMKTKFENITHGEGHCILVCGEAGIGKTSLIRAFCKEAKNKCKIYQGTCDALFSPRPLGPIYDIIWQMGSDIRDSIRNITDRAALFSRLFNELESQAGTTIIVIEDIHWADEATLDFVKFFVRRITRLHCLFVVTYRDNEIHSRHPLRTVLGQLPADTFTRMQLTPLSRGAVETMAVEKGYKGEDVFSISGGNPFYVNEILASYSQGIPDNIKDSILSNYNRLDEKTKQVWQILSVLPTGFEIKYLEKMAPLYAASIENCLDTKILISKGDLIFFKHELYRRTIENSLSPFVRAALNRRILDLFLEAFERSHETERIIHHAKNANEYELVVKYAPQAARQAASAGAHIEAAKLYFTAIEYYQGNDPDTLIQFYEAYAYECYLTGQIKEPIIYAEKSLNLLLKENDVEKISNCMRQLSWLWWFDCNREKAETYATRSIEVLTGPSSRIKAKAFAHMARLKMISDEKDECLHWSEKAMTLAKEFEDEEVLCSALTSMGTMLAKSQSSRQKGLELLQQSMDLALENNYEEYVGHVYVNLGGNAVLMKDYRFASKFLDEGIQFCDDRDLDLGTRFLLAYKARLILETGDWNEAYGIANNLIENANQPMVVRIIALVVAATIKMRRGHSDVLPLLIEAKEGALRTLEPQRIMPVMAALLEYEWITGNCLIEQAVLDDIIKMIEQRGNIYESSAVAFWLLKARGQRIRLREFFDGYKLDNSEMALHAAYLWEQLGCPYEKALSLFEGSDKEKRKAIEIVDKLGATAVFEKMKFEMRASGIRSIPRGIRKTTRSNPANLTERELDVLQLLKEGLQNKEIATRLFISPKTVDHHISAIFFKLDVTSRTKAVQEAIQLDIIKY
ncbi:MAG TPA: LuxR C-terminal-related transcriptional regulator [Chitinophagaceae bacterium]|nr:LuxR C-terminal-related transcriptional regulator [Chitinophagaceae bacterium]